jgi:D-arabinose 1-dehydrogenase-like Zn-dependent alcohol dehydrogenase
MGPFVGQSFKAPFAKTRTADLETLRELVEAEKIKPAVTATYTLDQVPHAIRDMRDAKIQGKAVILVEQVP